MTLIYLSEDGKFLDVCIQNPEKRQELKRSFKFNNEVNTEELNRRIHLHLKVGKNQAW
jgi:hypothetical protein